MVQALLIAGPTASGKSALALAQARERNGVIVNADALQVYGNWRRIREQDGTEGWMLATLLSARRTAVVTGNGAAEMHADPTTGSSLNWRAEPGVVGKISKCASGWCLFDVEGKRGYIQVDRIWGVEPGEVVE